MPRLQGPVRAADHPRPERSRSPTREFFVAFHSFQPAATGPRPAFYCINGRAYAGNTPTLRAERRRRRRLPRLRDRQRLPHLPHPRPSLDRRDRQRSIDNKTLGPGDSITARVHRGQPRPLVLPLPRVQPPAPGDERLVPRRVTARAGARACVVAGRGSAAARARRRRRTGGSRSATTSGRTRRSTSTSASTSPGTGSGPTRCTRSPASSPNAIEWDSDPGTLPAAQHRRQLPGRLRQARRLQLPVQAPLARCAARSPSRTRPAIPSAEPDPVPKSNVDLKKPVLRDARVAAEVRPPRRPAAVFDQRARQARRRVLPLQGQGQAEVRRLRDLQGPRRLQPRSSRREKAPFQAQAGPLHDRAAGYRQRPQHLQGPAAQVPDLVAAVRARRKVIYPGTYLVRIRTCRTLAQWK